MNNIKKAHQRVQNKGQKSRYQKAEVPSPENYKGFVERLQGLCNTSTRRL
jgi:hypothetical protein